MPSAFADQLARVRTVLEALDTGDDGAPLTNFVGTQPIESEPSILDRCFQVRAAGTGARRVDLISRESRFIVVIRYDLSNDQDGGEARIASDDVLIAEALEDSANRADGVNIVNLEDSSNDDSQRASGFLVRTHTFTVSYVSDSF